jgi:hypothetical protein
LCVCIARAPQIGRARFVATSNFEKLEERMTMRPIPSNDHRRSRRILGLAALVASSFAPFVACGGGGGGKADERFAPRTNDEYTEPLSNVVIGTPEGVLRDAVLMPDGRIVGGTPAKLDSRVIGVVPDSQAGGSDAPSIDGGAIDAGFSDAGPIGDGGVFDAGGEGGTGGSGGFGQWHFDDCSPTSNFLLDSSGLGANAQHALGAACVAGISGLGVDFRTAKDIVQVPDEPQFTIGSLVAAAAWVHPNTVSGNQPIIVKRLNSETAFSLGIHNGNIQMSVVLAGGTTVISQAPISAGVWTHVAGMYDGTFVFLFINGQQFGQVYGGGGLRNVFAPLRIGATTGSQHFDGIIDEVFVSTEAISKSTLAALSCIPHPSTVAVSPATSGPVPFDTTVHYGVTVSDNDVGFCNPRSYDMFFRSTDLGISTFFDPPGPFVSAQPGTATTIGVEVTGSDSADPGVHELPFVVDSFGQPPLPFEQLTGQLTYELTAPTGCFVFTKRELMITSTSVVDDPVRTFGNTPGGGGGGGLDGGVGTSDAGAGGSSSSSGSGGSSGVGSSSGTGSGSSSGSTSGGGSSGVAGSSSGSTSSGGSSGVAGSSSGSSSSIGGVPLPDGGSSPSLGAWSFAHLMREAAPTPEQAPASAPAAAALAHRPDRQRVHRHGAAPHAAGCHRHLAQDAHR